MGRFKYSVWVHTPDVTAIGALDLMAETMYFRHALVLAQHEQREFPDRTVRVFELVAPGQWWPLPWPGEKPREEGKP